MTQPLCKDCQKLLAEQADEPHDQLKEYAHHEASTVDGGFSEHEFRCQRCGHALRQISGTSPVTGWTELSAE